MASKYDIYWQDHLDAILVLFDQAHTAGTSAQLPLTGLDALGERGSWYGKLEIVNDRAVYHSAAHMQALGQALEGRLATWARTSCWVITVDKEVQMAVTQVEPPRTNWFENAYRNAKQTEVIQHAEAYLGPLAQEAASSGWCQTQSGKRVYVLFTAQKDRWLAPRRARLEAVAADGGDVVISLTDETSGRFDLWIIPAVKLIAAIQGAGFAPSLDRGNAYNFNLQIDVAADSIRQLNWDIRPYRRESGQTELTRAAFWPTDGPARAGEVRVSDKPTATVDLAARLAQWKVEATDPNHPNHYHANLDAPARVYAHIASLLRKLREETDAFTRDDVVALFGALNSGHRMKNKVADENLLPELRTTLLALLDGEGEPTTKIEIARQAIKYAAKNMLGELYGWANAERAPLYNTCARDALGYLGYASAAADYNTFVDAHARFKQIYLAQVGRLRPDLPLNLEIDKLYNVIDKVDLEQRAPQPVLAKPFSEMFADWEEAGWAFDLLAEAMRRLGVSESNDPMTAFTLRKVHGRYRVRFSYGSWLVLGLCGNGGRLTEVEMALLRQEEAPPHTGVGNFKQREGEKPISLYTIPIEAVQPFTDPIHKVYLDTLDYLKELFGGWQRSNLHGYSRGEIADAAFDRAARARLLSVDWPARDAQNDDGADTGLDEVVEIPNRIDTMTAVPGAAFSERAFELLEGLHREPTKAYYHGHKDEFKAEVEEPFQGLMAHVAESLPDQAREAMETQQGIFARFLKNDWGKGGTWDFYWGAFYPKGGKRTQDAQLHASVKHDFMKFGFSLGAYGSEQRQRFQQNCQTHHAALVNLLPDVFADVRLIFGRAEGITVAPDGQIISAEACTWQEFLADPARASSTVAVVLPRATVLHTSAEDLIADMAQTFGRLFPLVLLATETDPLRAIADYIEPPTQPLAHQNPAYPLAQCAAETGFAEDELAGWVRAIERKGQAIIYGPPGTGKTFIAERLAKHLIGGGNGFTELVQFHPAYAYEDFVQGIRPKTLDGGGLAYPTVPGRFLDFCDKASQCQGACVLIIDEINRANLARVFGELMYLLEYRDREVPLAGGGSLRIPPNVRVIGTMNTADRSIALVDHALRRRFAFLALYPNYDILRDFHRRASTGYPVEKLIQALTKLNDAIHDRHYHVGITFFLRKTLADEIADIWRMEIEPYLDEYFFDQPDKADAFRWQRLQADLQP